VIERIEQQAGVFRSLAIYYRPGRVSRLSNFYAQFVQPGSLCFDIGAHVGNRVAAWRHLGARVVAVEPAAHLMSWLRRFYGRAPDVTLVQAAVGAAAGAATLRHDPRNPTVASLSDSWIAAVSHEPSFGGVNWRAAEPVMVTTLDALITQYGIPQLCKIDIEGYETEALRGLSHPVPVVSFEYIPAVMDVAQACVTRLAELGGYEFNWFPGESHSFAATKWLTPADMYEKLDQLATERSSGDVFARLVSVAR
jgi:FkbM family methyltransferase